MARKKKLTPEQELRQHRDELMESLERWGEIKMHGCNDPGYPDGVNMNLVRNQIIWHRVKIMEICGFDEFPYPPEYFLEEPPMVLAGYMANLEQKERVERLLKMGYMLSVETGEGQ